MAFPFLPYGRQVIDEEDAAAVLAVLRSDYLTCGAEIERFETALARRCGVRFAVACSSGTAALHLAMAALDLGPGEALCTTPITFVATANAARFLGGDVVFADIDPDTVTMDPASLERVLRENPAVRVVVPVHFAGCPAAMEAIAAVAARHDAVVVEDGCHALGGAWLAADGSRVEVGSCRHSVMCVFSFHPVKPITTGEGGAVTTNDENVYRRLVRLRNHGLVRDNDPAWQEPAAALAADGTHNPWYYEMQELGFNYRITDIQCALGRSQLGKLDRFLARRRRCADRYRLRIADSAVLRQAVRPLVCPDPVLHAWHLFVVRVDWRRLGLERAGCMRALHAMGIGTQVHYIPVHRQPYYRRLHTISLPVSEQYYEQCLSLPLHAGMEDADVDRVVSGLETVVRQAGGAG